MPSTHRQSPLAKRRPWRNFVLRRCAMCGVREQRAALNVLNFLSNELRLSIVGPGTGESLHVMRTDPQIASRFESCALPSWTANKDLRRFLVGFRQRSCVDYVRLLV
jgi:hypothetical protein